MVGTEVVADRRGNRFHLDSAAFVRNIGRARALLPAGCALYQVIKGNGYGLGIERAIRLGLEGGVEGFCVGTPEEALTALECAQGKPIILFASCLPSEFLQLTQPGLIPTVHNLETLEAVGRRSPFLLELDCGFGRFGLDEGMLREAFARGLGDECLGAYTHFGSRSLHQLDLGFERFDGMAKELRSHLGKDILTMVAASHAMIWRPLMDYSAADPGSLLYGLLPKAVAPDFEPVVPHVAASILQINRITETQRLAIGYDAEIEISAGGRTGVFGLGWRDGLPAKPLGTVLVNGVHAPVIGRTLLHTIINLSAVPGNVAVGDEVVLVGKQSTTSVDIEQAADSLIISPTQFHFQIIGSIGCPPGSVR